LKPYSHLLRPSLPIANEPVPSAYVLFPIAIAFLPLASLSEPITNVLSQFAYTSLPTANDTLPLAFAEYPIAVLY